MACMSLTQRIQLEQGTREPSEVKILNLERSKSATIEGLTEDFTNLENLSLANVGLENISGLPKLGALKTLDLSCNLISGGLESLLNCPSLTKLNLSSNKISSVETLIPLSKLSNLRSLDLSDCNITDVENYRKLVFAALPNLKYLDGSDENNYSEPESEDRSALLSNGVDKNSAEEDDDEDTAEDDDEHESDDEDEEEDHYGIEALQGSDLEDDDEEDYAPEEEPESDDYDEDLDEEEDVVEDTGADLSGADIMGPRRPASKRKMEKTPDEEGDVTAAKQQAGADANEAE